MATSPVAYYTVDQYLKLDAEAEFPFEYCDGHVIDMSGGTPEHAWVQSNIAGEMRVILAGRCRVATATLRVRTSPRMYAYPDVVIVCAEPEYVGEQARSLVNPVALVEVLSPSTEGYERGLKFQRYRNLPSFQEYVLVNQGQPWVELYTRQDGGLWTYRDFRGLDQQLKIESLGVAIPLARIYEGIKFQAEPEEL